MLILTYIRSAIFSSSPSLFQSRNFLFLLSPKSITRIAGKASRWSNLSRSSKVLLTAILPPVPDMVMPPVLFIVSPRFPCQHDPTYVSSGSGSLSSRVILTSLPTLLLYSDSASSMACFTAS